MKIIILGAGAGKRLYQLTKDVPKALLRVGDETILTHQLKCMQTNGILNKDIYFVAGYQIDLIKENIPPGVNIIENQRYYDTNNIYSLWLTKDLINDDFIIINSDIIFHEDILNNVIHTDYNTALAIDDYRKLDDEDMKVQFIDGKLKRINKNIDLKDAMGEYIGIARFSKNDGKLLFSILDDLIKQGKINDWYEKGIELLAEKININNVSTKGLPWIEIDTMDDFIEAQEIIKKIYPK